MHKRFHTKNLVKIFSGKIMCLIVFANKFHKDYKLIFAANRDEFYDRPAVQAEFWNDHPDLLAGKDLQAGGTWMGITKAGRFAAITNYRDMKNIKNNAPSRGRITLDYLVTDVSAEDYFLNIKNELKDFNGFNLVLGNRDELFYFSSINAKIEKINPGIHGLSNAFLDTPWQKVKISKKRFQNIIQKNNFDESELFDLLSSTEYADDEQLPDTGAGKNLEKILSPVFIKSEKYGTRCSTVLLIDKNDNVHFVEKTFIPFEKRFTTKEFKFKLSLA